MNKDGKGEKEGKGGRRKGRAKWWKEQQRDGWHPTISHPLGFAVV